MDFIKKHYEKVILGIVLLGLVAGLLTLPFLIAHDRDEMERFSQTIITPKIKPLPPIDLSAQTNIIERLGESYHLDFESTNKLFNPVQWQKTPDNHLIKLSSGSEASLVTVSNITPLYFILTLDSVNTNSLGPPRYVVSFERQAAPIVSQRRKQQRYVSMDDKKKDVFTLLDVKGPPENPTEVVLQLADTGEIATVSAGHPFQRIDGYAADLKYDPEGRKWVDQRVGADLKFANGDYIIVAINRNEVVISAPNQKKTTLRLKQ